MAAKCALALWAEHTRSNLEWGDFLLGVTDGGFSLFDEVVSEEEEVIVVLVWRGRIVIEWRVVVE